jgi:hypothetical protein
MQKLFRCRWVRIQLSIRRSGSMALGIDQIPESLLPAIAAHWALPVTVFDAAILAGLFFIGELAASRVLFALNIRDRPY